LGGISVNSSALEIRIIDETLVQPLAGFFRALKRAGDDRYFHPHPLTDEEARRRAHYSGKDLYYVLAEGDMVLGYGVLRGWDEGYEVPSLGIAIYPSVRGMGLSKLFMHFLHVAARRRGASKVRLKVHPDNTAAVTLYKRLGYTFQSEEAGQLVGFIEL
jgi:ribosomal-protein-alanine N-acetyltransferase